LFTIKKIPEGVNRELKDQLCRSALPVSLENRTYFTQTVTGSLTKIISHTALFRERLRAERDERK